MIIRPPWTPALKLGWHRPRLVNQQTVDRLIENAERRGARASGTASSGGYSFQCDIPKENILDHPRVREAYAEWAAAGFPPVSRVVPRLQPSSGRAGGRDGEAE